MKNKWLEIIANIIFWVISSWLVISIFSIESQEIEIINGTEIKTIKRDAFLIKFFVVGQLLNACYFYLQLGLIRRLSGELKLRQFLAGSFFLALLILTSYYVIVWLFIFKRPITFPSVTYGVFIFYVVAAIAYGFIKIWIKIEQDKKQLELINNQAELNLLRSQLHPHFLFNTMNNLLSMVDQKQNPKLAKSIGTLSDLLRYVIYDARSDKVTLTSEINFIQNFAKLHLLRFEEEEIDFKLNIIGGYDHQLIEPGILLCFVENAFKHGVQPEIKSFIHIDIDISSEDVIIFKVENSKPPKIGNENKGGYGLKSTKERLNLAYGDKHILEIKDSKTYSVLLKIITHESNNS